MRALGLFGTVGTSELLMLILMFIVVVLGGLFYIILNRTQRNSHETKVRVSNKQDMETSISSHIVRGFVLMNKTEISAILVKKKQFSVPIAIIGFLFCFIGLGIYAIVYAFQSDEVVEIMIVNES